MLPECSRGFESVANFSIESDSPVRLDWLTNKSFDSTMRTSAGIMSPADSITTSPGTSSSLLVSSPGVPPLLAVPARTT